MNIGRGRRLVDMVKLSNGVDAEMERVQQLAEPQCSRWPDTLISEEQNILTEPIDDIITHTPEHNPYVQDTFSPSLLASIPSSHKDKTIMDQPFYTSDGLCSPDDDNYIPNTSENSSSDSMKSKRKANFTRPITINESSEIDTDKETNVKELKTRKRLKRPETWKCNIRRKKTVCGKSHMTQKGKIISAKTIKNACFCKKVCGAKIDDTQRKAIFENYWNELKTWDMKRQFILACVRQKPIERRRVRNEESTKQRNRTLEYSFIVDKTIIIVCKTFFLGTLGISETVVRNSIKKSNDYGIVEEDKRGKKEPPNKTANEVIDRIKKHIESFPKYESHYSREKTGREYLGAHIDIKLMYKLYMEECRKDRLENKLIAKIWTYRKIFNTNFNLGFKPPETDTCDDCDRFVVQIRSSQGTEKENINNIKNIKYKYKEHVQEAKTRYDLKAFDKLKCRLNPDCKMITVDLQKCLPTPLLTNSLSFYLRKLWTFNYTILDSVTNNSTCIMWDESISGRGGNELSSGLIKWFEKNVLNTQIREITIWSDNCAGQNKNIHIIMCYLWLIRKIPNLQCINHKYLMKGHTHMEVDGIHSIIERKKKRQPQFSITTPWDWQQFIRSCSSDKAPIEVIDMSSVDFKNLLNIQEGPTAPFIHRKKGEMGQAVPYSEIVWMKFVKEEYGTMSYKTSFHQEDFEKVSLIRKRRSLQDFAMPELQPIRLGHKPISTKKFQDLQKALQWVPPLFHNFYNTLAQDGTACDLPE